MARVSLLNKFQDSPLNLEFGTDIKGIYMRKQEINQIHSE